MELTLAELAERLGARLRGDGSMRVHGVAGIREATTGQVTFLANPRYAEFLPLTRASAVIVSPDVADVPTAALITPEPYLAFVEALRIFEGDSAEAVPAGRHPTALVDASADIDPSAGIGPFVVVGAGARIGARSVLMAGTYLGPAASLGADCLLYPRVTIRKESEIGDRVVIHAGAVIGDDGFGFAPDGEGYRKIPQVGRVVIGDDCEIGANTTIDRATTGVTRIGRGCRIDNLVMIAHGVVVGENTIICAQAGISGSTQIGRRVVLAGQAGLAGHITIGDGARIGAQGGVTKSVPPGESWSGYPARPHLQASRAYAALRDLPDALKRLRRMEQRLSALEQNKSVPGGDKSA
jgi:UDP-3-O-[3-hydroxymyristoyl] glucosamine N-acyltransferase